MFNGRNDMINCKITNEPGIHNQKSIWRPHKSDQKSEIRSWDIAIVGTAKETLVRGSLDKTSNFP